MVRGKRPLIFEHGGVDDIPVKTGRTITQSQLSALTFICRRGSTKSKCTTPVTCDGVAPDN